MTYLDKGLCSPGICGIEYSIPQMIQTPRINAIWQQMFHDLRHVSEPSLQKQRLPKQASVVFMAWSGVPSARK